MMIVEQKRHLLSVPLGKEERGTSLLILIAIGLVSAGVMLAEISLTRIFSVTIWYHFSFVAISLAMLGMAGAAVFVYLYQKKYGKDRLYRLLPVFSLLSALFSILALSTYLSIDYHYNITGASMSVFRLVPTLLFFPGFYMAGIVICTLIAQHAANVNKLYFSDLVCAGVGGAISVFLLDFLSGPIVFAVSAALIALSACFLPGTGRSGRIKNILPAGGLLVIVLIIFVFNFLGLMEVKYTKDYDETRLDKIYEKWSAFSRITVFKKRWFDLDRPFGWGLSQKYKAPPVEEMWLEQDGSAGSTIIRTDGDLKKLDFLDWDVTAVAYAMKKYNCVCVIGLGGGRDVLLAVKHGAKDVVGVEINKDIVDIITDRFASYVGYVFNRDPVRVVVADGRTFMEKSKKKFDMIQISLIDSWAASAAGAYVLAENNLYTLQAFEAYFERLSCQGVLSISRWAFTRLPGETIRLVTLSLETLKKSGVENPPAHIAVIKGKYIGTVLVKKKPFTKKELDRLQAHCKKMGFEVLYLPEPGDWLPSIAKIIKKWRNLQSYLKQLPLDFSAPSDDRPFFFLMLKPWDTITLGTFNWDTGIPSNFVAVKTLYILFAILLVVVLLIVIWPACQMRKQKKIKVSPWTMSILFMFLGLGFMMIEIPLIQKLVLVLGHPIYALSVVLSTLLVSSGIGAAFSKKLIFSGISPDKRLASALFALSIIVITFFILVNLLSHQLLRSGGMARFSISIIFTALCGFIMGLPFPSIVFALKQRGEENAIPWLWAVNGAASVLGSVLAFVSALLFGFTITAAMGCLCYLIVALLVIKIKV